MGDLTLAEFIASPECAFPDGSAPARMLEHLAEVKTSPAGPAGVEERSNA